MDDRITLDDEGFRWLETDLKVANTYLDGAVASGSDAELARRQLARAKEALDSVRKWLKHVESPGNLLHPLQTSLDHINHRYELVRSSIDKRPIQ